MSAEKDSGSHTADVGTSGWWYTVIARSDQGRSRSELAVDQTEPRQPFAASSVACSCSSEGSSGVPGRSQLPMVGKVPVVIGLSAMIAQSSSADCSGSS